MSVLGRIRRCELESATPGGRKKATTPAWCMYEAFRDGERAFLQTAQCLSVAQDASTRGPYLLTRYVDGAPSMERRSGILMITSAKGSGAPDLAQAILKGIRNVATKRRAHPHMLAPKQPAKRLEALAGHVSRITVVFSQMPRRMRNLPDA